MIGEPGQRLKVGLDQAHAVKLAAMADRLGLRPGLVASVLLSAALDQVDPEAAAITAVLEAIPGAWERGQAGLAALGAGQVVPLDQL